MEIGFDPTNANLYILVFRKRSKLIIVGVYINDLALAVNKEEAME